jgi:uncharacterized protein YjbI with pentapeptide repeats
MGTVLATISDLVRADLVRADLMRGDLVRADLAGLDLLRAVLVMTSDALIFVLTTARLIGIVTARAERRQRE